MTMHVLPFWDIMPDAIQIFLCGIILICLIRNKLKYKQLILKTPPTDKSAVFANEIHLQTLQQQTAKTFDTILDFINQERHALKSYWEIEATHSSSSLLRMQAIEAEKAIKRVDDEINAETNAADYANILQLSENGLTAKQISQKVNAPRGEVELVLRMNNRGAEHEKRSPLRAKA
ncbi:MAG: hypothetical protein JSV83_01260 [Desulfobacterales bacterium]|nr:MAG: hypothetical protein JSV83_01260 [Desulfobacterales bacterium]